MTPSEAKRVLNEELHWPDWMIELGVRASFRCEYCGRDMLETADTYDLWQVDHIVPDGNDDMANLAVACKTCNFIKRHSDPRVRTENTDRDSLLEAAREIVNERRRSKQDLFVRTKAAIEVLRPVGSSEFV